ncbi:hypothetical protein D9V34_02330 [Mycetocola lacteus]|uniref:Sugar phosphotransferase n=1 Tax=Mycetocola lacteus TaxID=76637 RepID=A0A3L7AVL7_9MICO|nr:stealth family protein [Mycetocola lacteus]RLP84214.1 hypothetical protein D9V34_02330 [Mycetocola lacteus]
MSSPQAEPIDVVVTWVDGNNREWLERRAAALGQVPPASAADENEQRYRDWGLFQFWFRALETNCPWVNKVFLVTAGHVPAWLDLDHPKLVVVDQDSIVPEAHQPTFNSQAVEANFHRIPELSERFIYFNDDFYVGAPLSPEFFFPGGLPYGVGIFDAMSMNDAHAHAMLNASALLNKHFDKRTVLRKNLSKWFTLRYGAEIYRNIALFPWKQLLPVIDPHLPTPILKSSMVEAFAAAKSELADTSASAFRAYENIAPIYLVNMWQLLTGKFEPRNRHKIGRYLGLGIDPVDEIVQVIEDASIPLFCLNDVAVENTEELARATYAAFTRRFPARSSFERAD